MSSNIIFRDEIILMAKNFVAEGEISCSGSTQLKDVAWLWHFCYGCLNFVGLKTLQQKNMVIKLSQIECSQQVFVEYVLLANNTTINFHKESHGE